MKPLAANPYCVWTDGHMRTYKALARAKSAAGSYGRIGVWSDAEGWWVESPSADYNAEDYAQAIHAEDLAKADA